MIAEQVSYSFVVPGTKSVQPQIRMPSLVITLEDQPLAVYNCQSS